MPIDVMPRRISTGCFHLPCTRVEFSVKSDHLVDSTVDCNLPPKRDLLKLTSEDLSLYTDQFSPQNFIVQTKFGDLYRGKMSIDLDGEKVTKDVSIKILAEKTLLGRVQNELIFLQNPTISGHPNLVKPIGYCGKGGKIGVVYDVNPLDTLHNTIIRDDFKWMQRIKTALALARLLVHLHDRRFPYLIRSFDPSHIVVDQNLTPIVFEFGMLYGGFLPKAFDESDKEATLYGFLGSYGYVDPCIITHFRGHGACNVKSDVYTLGGLLLNLISKRVIERENVAAPVVNSWATEECSAGRSIIERENVAGPVVNSWATEECSAGRPIVHQSLVEDPDFDPRDGRKLTKLAMQCISHPQKDRPELKEVLKCLMKLRVMQKHGGGEGSS